MAFDPPFSAEEERDLIARTQKGERQAFARLVEGHRERAYAGALSLTQNPEDARDMSQEAFVRAFQAIGRFRLGRPFYPWYYRILRNLCLTHLQRHGPSRMVSLEYLVEEQNLQPADKGEGVRTSIQRSQLATQVRAAMEELKPEFKEILAMKHFEEMSYQEMAQALKLPIGTVMSRLFYARKSMKDVLERRGIRAEDQEP